VFGHKSHHAIGEAHAVGPVKMVAFFDEREYVANANSGKVFINHCWTVHDGEIWDLTAEQFDVTDRAILVLPDRFESDYHPYFINPTFRSFKAWPREQQPTLNKVRSLLRWLPDPLFFKAMEDMRTFKQYAG